jgi:hypothetical protein
MKVARGGLGPDLPLLTSPSSSSICWLPRSWCKIYGESIGWTMTTSYEWWCWRSNLYVDGLTAGAYMENWVWKYLPALNGPLLLLVMFHSAGAASRSHAYFLQTRIAVLHERCICDGLELVIVLDGRHASTVSMSSVSTLLTPYSPTMFHKKGPNLGYVSSAVNMNMGRSASSSISELPGRGNQCMQSRTYARGGLVRLNRSSEPAGFYVMRAGIISTRAWHVRLDGSIRLASRDGTKSNQLIDTRVNGGFAFSRRVGGPGSSFMHEMALRFDFWISFLNVLMSARRSPLTHLSTFLAS